ncbi:hypothetical protein T265_06496 [Opisthorchis viverrini]|uniref:Uncharacterized protein n=1 Tax=Opisthorchis viverrini TaxID=6198 RepID=A0A074ZKE1_OPIVI|nr:hypothetical protein T265_06496 [Opisthorchis viverrini]KER26217.1 hypothetical protein T265_06496 [Opisthorchis viverrini]
MKEIIKRLGAVRATRLPGWRPSDSYCAWLETLQDMAANRCQWRPCCQFLSRLPDGLLLRIHHNWQTDSLGGGQRSSRAASIQAVAPKTNVSFFLICLVFQSTSYCSGQRRVPGTLMLRYLQVQALLIRSAQMTKTRSFRRTGVIGGVSYNPKIKLQGEKTLLPRNLNKLWY